MAQEVSASSIPRLEAGAMRVYWIGFAFLMVGIALVISSRSTEHRRGVWSIGMGLEAFGLGMMVASMLVSTHWIPA